MGNMVKLRSKFGANSIYEFEDIVQDGYIEHSVSIQDLGFCISSWKKLNDLEKIRLIKLDYIKTLFSEIHNRTIDFYDETDLYKKELVSGILMITETRNQSEVLLDLSPHIDILADRIGKHNDISYSIPCDGKGLRIQISTREDQAEELKEEYKYLFIECLDGILKVKLEVVADYDENIRLLNEEYLNRLPNIKTIRENNPIGADKIKDLYDFDLTEYPSLDDLRHNVRIVKLLHFSDDLEHKKYLQDIIILRRSGDRIYYHVLRSIALNVDSSMQEFIYHANNDYNYNTEEDDQIYGQNLWGSHKRCNYVGYGNDISDLLFHPNLAQTDLNNKYLRDLYIKLLENPLKDLLEEQRKENEKR